MAGYKYNLQRLLDIRISKEQEKKNQMGLAVQRLEKEKQRLKLIKEELYLMKNRFAEETSEGMEVNELKLLINYINYYKRSIKDQKLKIKMAEDHLSICRAELLTATQEKKMIEKLKEKDFEKYLYQEQKKEEKLVDDLVSFKENNKS